MISVRDVDRAARTASETLRRRAALADVPAFESRRSAGTILVPVALVVVLAAGVALLSPRPAQVEFSGSPPAWQHIPNAPMDGTQDGVAAWVGDRLLVWGGMQLGTDVSGPVVGERFNPATGESVVLRQRRSTAAAAWTAREGWQALPDAPVPAGSFAEAVWTGTVMLTVGVSDDELRIVAYDPQADVWSLAARAPVRLSSLASVWTGTVLYVWGADAADPGRAVSASYNPRDDRWEQLDAGPLSGRLGHDAAWTGQEVVIWGGGDEVTDLADGAAFNVEHGTWRLLPGGPLAARHGHAMGTVRGRVLVWGGSSGPQGQHDGALYDPGTNQWEQLPDAPITPRDATSVAITRDHLVVGVGDSDSAVLNLEQRTWSRVSGGVKSRCRPAVAVDSDAVALWGGDSSCGDGSYLNDAGLLRLPAR